MRRLAFALSLLCAPALALAVFTRPSDLLLTDRVETRPSDISMEMHARMKDMNASLWMRGVSEGSDIETAKGSFRVTVDIAQDSQTVRAKAQIRVVDRTLYAKLESLTSDSMIFYSEAARQYANGDWYSLRLDDVEQSHGIEDGEVKEIVRQMVDALFTLERSVSGKDSVYSLKLRKDGASALRGLLDKLGEEHVELAGNPVSGKDLAELRKIFAKTNVHVKVTADTNDLPKSVKFYAAYEDKEFGGALSGLSTFRATSPEVRAPAKAIPLEGGMGQDWSDAGGSSSDDVSTRDAQRRSDVNTLLNAVYQYAIDHEGKLPVGIPYGTGKPICRSKMSCSGVNLDVLLESYLVEVPVDPDASDRKTSGYTIFQDRTGRVTVSAPLADTEAISITR